MPRSASALAAPRVRSTECPWPDSPVEYDNSATRGAPSSPCADAAVARAISISSSCDGATLTAQSVKIKLRPSGNSIRKNEDGVVIFGSRPMAMLAASITRFVALSAPATIASACPVATIAAARYNGLASRRLAIASFIPRACVRTSIWASQISASGIGWHSPSACKRAAALATRGSPNSGNTTFALRSRARAYIFSKIDMYTSVYSRRRQQ